LSGKGDNKRELEESLSLKVNELQDILSDIISGIEEDGTIEKQVGDFNRRSNSFNHS